MLLTISPFVAFLLTFLVVAAIGALVGYIVSEQSTLGGFVSSMIGLAVAVVLGILIWLVIVSTVTFTAPAVAYQPAQPLAYQPAQSLALPATGPSSAQPVTSGSCSAAAVNPVDGTFVALTSGNYVIEDFDNSLPQPKHTFWSYDTASQGSITVMATAMKGTRAWACTDQSSAFETAMKTAMDYKSHHANHAVFGPDAVEVK